MTPLSQIRHEWRQGDRLHAVLMYLVLVAIIFGAALTVCALVLLIVQSIVHSLALVSIAGLAALGFREIVR